MKKLLLFAGLIIGSVSANAQLSCGAPQAITSEGIINAPAITGTYINNCFGDTQTGSGGTMYALWYTYTATANGELTVSSDLVSNGTAKNTDLSVLTGICGASTLNCYTSSDDVSSTNKLSKTTFPVESGKTYFLAWDNFYDASSFDFEVSFDAMSCMKVYSSFAGNYTTTSATAVWAPAIGSPANYIVDWSTDLNAAAGTGTLVDVPAGSQPTYVLGDLSPLPAESNFRYFVRSNCGGGDLSDWTGPFMGFLAKSLPYANSFEDTTDGDGFQPDASWRYFSIAALAQDGNSFAATQSSVGAPASNSLLFSRALALKQNETVTLTFYTRLYVQTGTPSNLTLKVWVNDDTTLTGATQVGPTLTISGTTYTKQTVTYTATVAGVYYFMFNNTTPSVATTTLLLLDNVNFGSNLGVNDYLTSQFSVYPNPAKNVVTFANGVNALINTVEMTDLNGRMVKSLNVNATEGQISISDLATGMYMMRISTDKGIAVKKIVKE